MKFVADRRHPYVIAAVIVLVAAVVRAIFLQGLGIKAPFITFYPAVMLAALYGGLRAGALAAALSAAVADYFWIEPTGSLIVENASDWLGLGIFLANGVLVSWVADRLLKANANLDRDVAAKTAALAAALDTSRDALIDAARLAAIVASSSDAILSKVLDGTITSWNAAATRLFGYSVDEMIGRNITRIIPPERLDEEDMILARLKNGESIDQYETIRVAKDGRRVDVSVTISPIKDASGNVSGASKVIRDITERKRVEQALAEQAELIDIAHEAIMVREITGEIVFWNRGAEEIYGFGRSQAVGSVTHVLLRTGFPKPLAEIDADLLRDGRWEGDLLHTTLDGRRLAVASRWVLQGGSPDKPRRVMEINSDITERKKAEEQVRLLMGEVNHRSKNVLSVVQSIAMLSSKLADPATYASDLSKRIAGLSACQDLLLHSEWRGVDVAELVRAQLAPFHDLFNRRILLTGAVLRLNAEAAQALGMALHELATNAAKYGALSNSDGRVKIEWSVTSTEDESQFQMQWLEEGGPTVVAPTRKGFGQKVIVSMVEGAVKGKVEVEYRETGVCWKLTSPVQNTIETA